MSPAPRSNESPFSDPVTGYETRRSWDDASAPATSAAATPTTSRAETMTTRPHGDTRIPPRLAVAGCGSASAALGQRHAGEHARGRRDPAELPGHAEVVAVGPVLDHAPVGGHPHPMRLPHRE